MGRPGEALIALLGEHGVEGPGARLYLAACRRGPQSASELARLAALDRVQAYRWIKLLTDRGLLRIQERRPMRFAALPVPDLLDQWIHKTAQRLDRLKLDRERLVTEWDESLTDPALMDGGMFHVFEGRERIHHFLAKRIGLAQREILATASGFALATAIQGGIGRALEEAHRRGVRIRLVTEIGPGNLAEAKYFLEFTQMRQGPGAVHNRTVLIDRAGALVYVTGQEGLGESEEHQVALWSTAPRFVRLARDYNRRVWSRGTPADQRIVEVDSPSPAILPMYRDRPSEPLSRLTDVARLGMQATGLRVLKLDLPELIETVARQMGRQIAKEVDGGTPQEVAQSLVGFYGRHALGKMTIAKDKPLTLKVSGCFACTATSPEVGRVLCPAMIGGVLETRLGARWDVSKPDPTRHATRGCLFSVTPV